MAVIRGEPVEDFGESVPRWSNPQDDGSPPTFRDVARHAMMLDLDGVQLPEGLDVFEDFPACARWVLENHAPEEVRGADAVVQASSGCGLRDDRKDGRRFKAHAWFWLATARTSAELKRWAKVEKSRCPELDTGVFQPVQLHYTANPAWLDAEDPIGERVVFLEGARRTVGLTIPAEPEAPNVAATPERIAAMTEAQRDRGRLIAERYVRETCERIDKHPSADGGLGDVIRPRCFRIGQWVAGLGMEEELVRADLAAAIEAKDPEGRSKWRQYLDASLADGRHAPSVPDEALEYCPDLSRFGARAKPPANDNRRAGITPADVLATWQERGPLVHVPTGMEELDAATGGGFILGSRVYIAGAPDAGKTALLIQIADAYARRDIAVGLLAVDEEPDDIVTRLAQRSNIGRLACERRSEGEVRSIEAAVGSLPIRFYTPEFTIEDAARDLAEWAAERGMRAVLGIDSIQTASCEAEQGRDPSAPEAVTARVAAVRAVATEFQMLVIATSEMNRGAYRSRRTEEQVDPMAAAKWSGSIEYSARVLLTLRSVPGEPDLIQLSIPKNKHGRSRTQDPIYLRLDRARQVLHEDRVYAPGDPNDARDGAAVKSAMKDAAAVAVVLATRPGLGTRELRAAVKSAKGMGKDRCDAALSLLGDAVVRARGSRNTSRHRLDGAAVAPEVLALVPEDNRGVVRSSVAGDSSGGSTE